MTTRAARWSRVSSKRQAETEREGLPFQRDLQDDGIRTLSATDTGIEWVVAHSGASVHQTPEWEDMLARAGRDFDTLIVAYTSRLARDAEQLLAARRLLHSQGAAIYFCEERVLTSDETTWESFAREAVEAESYRRRLSRTMKRTYASRVRRKGIPAGPPPYGFTADWQHDPIEAPIVSSIFTSYANSTASLADLATQYGLAEEHVKVIIRNPAYAGWAQHNGELHPGSMPPIVSPELWDRVVARRESRQWYTPGPKPIRPSMLRGIAYCQCGRRLRLDGYDGSGAHRVRHMRPLCATWGTSERRRASDIESPIREALRRLTPSRDYLRQLLQQAHSAARSPETPRIDTRPIRRRLALDFAAGKIDQEHFLSRVAQLDEADASTPEPVEVEPITLRALDWYFSQLQAPDPDLGDHTAFLSHWARRIFTRVIWAGTDQLIYEPTAEALRHFVIQAMPARIGYLVGGEGLEPPTSSV